MAQLRRREALAPSEEGLRRTERNYRMLSAAVRFGMGRKVKHEVVGLEHVPRSGPALVLSNHVGFFDPAWLILAADRPIHFLTSQATMTDSKLAHVMRMFGAVPKQKAAADPKAIRGLQGWVKVGGLVGLFPEGERSWDGRALPFLPGIQRLVRLLQIPVITTRIENADLCSPRWGAGQKLRRGRIRITFDPPRTFARKHDPDDLLRILRASLSVDPAACWRAPIRGRRLAHGLSNLLYACPDCGGIEQLHEEGDAIRCRRCEHAWRVDEAHALRPLHEDTSPRPVYELSPLVDERFASLLDERLASGVTLVESLEPVEALELGDTEVRSLGVGQLRVEPDAVRLVGAIDFPISEIGACTIEIDRRLQLLLRQGKLIELVVPRESVVKIKRAVDHALAAHSRR